MYKLKGRAKVLPTIKLEVVKMKKYRVTYWTEEADTIRALVAVEAKADPHEEIYHILHPFHIVAIEPMD